MSFTLVSDIPFRAKKFWVQVLRRAVFDYVLYKGVGSRRKRWQSAFNYIFITDQQYNNLPDGAPAFGFEEVCSLFSWNPDYIRRLTTQLTRSDIKRMEMSSFEDEFTQDILAAFVSKSGSWSTSRAALPFYPRMIDEFSPTPATVVIRREVLSRSAPLVQWQSAV
jgi:hypothetical protein